MMRRIKNGEPVFHTHECSEDRKGKVMTAEELHDFAVQVLMEEYSDTNAEVVKYDKKDSNEADFYFVNSGKRPNFSVGAFGEKKVNVLVVYKEETDKDIADIDTSWMVEEYRRTGAIPRVTFANAWCIYGEDKTQNGKPALCGGDFCFKYYSVSLLPDEKNEPLAKNLSDIELANMYSEAWRKFDASIVEPYLDKDFHYGSDWVFDEMPSRKEYLDYFTAKLATVKSKASQMAMGVCRNHQTGDVGVIIKDGDVVSVIYLTISEGRITSGIMKEHDKHFKVIDPDEELYMNHGDHLDCIMPSNRLIQKYLHPIIQEAKAWRTARTAVTTEDMYEERTTVFSLMYGTGDVRLLATIAASKKNKRNEFMSIYPFGNGVPYEVTIDKVLEWDNQIEATVLCSIGEFEFAFFPIDYYCNKEKYQEGEKLTVDLSALGMKVEEAQRGFQFEGQQAIDWLAKIGEKPNYDEDGNVEPVKFSMENMVAFFNKNSKCPDEAEFQSPAGEIIESSSVLGVDFFKTDVIIFRRDTDDGELQVTIPLYFRRDFFPTVQKADPIRGWLWITGSVVGQHEQEGFDNKEEPTLAKLAADFEEYMDSINIDQVDDLMGALSELPLLKIRRGYVLDVFEEGDSHGSRHMPYCHTEGAYEHYYPTDVEEVEENQYGSLFGMFKKERQTVKKKVHIPYDDSLLIHGRIGFGEADDVPPILPYFYVPFTEEGIMQAWLLDNITDFMPRGWHMNYNTVYYVFDTERIEKMFPVYDEETCGSFGRRSKVRDEVLALNLETLLPSVKITGDKAILEYAYWNDWRGMVKSTVEVVKDGDSVKFSKPENKVLVAYDCGIMF